MARLEDLQDELERLGREVEEDILRAGGNRSHASAPMGETPINIRLTIPRGVNRLHISISLERSANERQ